MTSKFLFFILLTSQFLIAQDIYNKHVSFFTIFEQSAKANPYYSTGNPAFLEYDLRDQLLSIESGFKSNSGELKEFFDPGTERLYDLSFSGKKSLESNQIFKGMFSLQRHERRNWNWLTTKNYKTGSPFLFGDSTSGNTRYNGILLNAQYSVKFFEKLSTGFSFSYGVDEGLKEIAPRPTSSHRDIDITLGGAYDFTKSFSAGVYFRTFDMLEQINYNEDEGALYDETILIKFRGYDYPLRISKKVESRISYHNRYYLNSDLFYKTSYLNASAYLGSGTDQITIKEGLSNPRMEGYFNNDLLNAGLVISYRPAAVWNAGVSYKFNKQQMWAKHPQFNTLIMSNDINSHNFSLGVEYRFTDKLSCGIELNSEYSNNDYQDYYGNVFYDYNSLMGGIQAGISYRWSEIIKNFIAAGYGRRKPSEVNTFIDKPSGFYLNSRYADLGYMGTELLTKSLDFSTEINSDFPGIIKIYVSYRYVSAGDGAMPEYLSASKSYLDAALELKIKVY